MPDRIARLCHVIQSGGGARYFCSVAMLVTLLFYATSVGATGPYPVRQVRVIVAFAPGGIADVLARVIGQKLSSRFGQTFVIENRSGAGGALGAKVVAAAAPDGYTLLVTTSALAINAVAMQNAIDPKTQLSPIAVIASAPTIFVVNKDVSAVDLMAFVRDLKKGRFTYATAGVGTAEHLTTEFLFKKSFPLDATHVPFAGGVEAVNAAANKTVDVASATVPSALSMIRGGSVRVLAVASDHRLPSLPSVPTLKEEGFGEVVSASWIAIFGPAGLPPTMVDQLNKEVNAALAQPDVMKKLASLGFVAQPQSQPAFQQALTSEIAKWGEITKAIGFAPN